MSTDTTDLRRLTDRLLKRDARAHREALSALAECGDERVVPHLIEVEVIDAIASDWPSFGFPEVLRDRDPPRYLELPEAAWPGVEDALEAITGVEFDSGYAWIEWETWYSQQDVEPLDGFEEWKLRLYRSFLPPVGGLLDVEPRSFDLQEVRWGNCDRSFLAALNEPDFVPGEAVDAGEGDPGEGNDGAANAVHERYLNDDDHVFGFEVGGRAYAVPRWVIFPHEMLNVELAGAPLSLTFCTLCNAPILYDCRVDGETLTFGNTGMLVAGNKVMFDDETGSLWSQHRGVPVAGEFLERDPDLRLDHRLVVRTDWRDWKREHPDTLALSLETGYDFDYRFYEGEPGIFRHYWENEDVVQPGVERAESALPEKERVYAVTGEDPDVVYAFPVESVSERGALAAEVDGRGLVATADPAGDVAVYEAPALPVERADDVLVDADGTRWTVAGDGLVAGDGRRLGRVVGRHGLWFAFRVQYPEAVAVTGE